MKTFISFGLMILLVSGCSSGSKSSESPKEFIADLNHFHNLTKWAQTVPARRGPDPSGMLGMAHMANNDMSLRTIYVNEQHAVRGSNGQFPIGTIFAKDVSVNGKSMMVTGMVKRGGGYNKNGNGWEYFTIMNGMIAGRGDTLMNGMCMGCHMGAGKEKDYVFTR